MEFTPGVLMLSSLEGPGRRLDAISIRHLPIIKEVFHRMGIFAIFNEIFPKQDSQKVSDAVCLLVLILAIFATPGRIALFKLEDWVKTLDIELLLGRGHFLSHFFNDDRFALLLDHIFAFGCDNILGRVVSRWLASDISPPTFTVHQDITSLVLYGMYERDIADEAAHPAKGHSKDKRPDLRQLMFGLSLQGGTNFPLDARHLDGNTADCEANRDHLSALARRLPDPDAVTFVGDCKLVDANTLGELRSHRFHFVSLLPRNFALRRQLVDRVCAQDGDMPVLRQVPGSKKADSPRTWRGRSLTEKMSLRDPSTQELHEHTLRFLVVHSSGLTERFEKGLPKKVDAELKKLGKAVKKYNKRMFSCEEDATGALADAPQGQWHRLSWSVTEQVIELPYPNPGRPKRGQKRPTRTVWRCVPSALERDEEAIERARRSASHFVLVTDHLDEKSWSDARVEAEYHQQSTVEGHTGFRWLKGPAGLAPVFLHKPERIMAMGLVFVLALMVRNYVQFELRRRLRESDRELEILNRRWTSRPTTEAALELFGGVGLVVIRENAYDEVVERHVTNLEYPARQVLKFLGLPVSIFTEPRPDDGQHPPPRYPG